MHRVVELIQSGAIGDVSEVHSWVSSSRGMKPRLTEPQTIPNTLDYDLWLGPAKDTPYDSQITPYGWRFVRKDVLTGLCKVADGENPVTGNITALSLMCP